MVVMVSVMVREGFNFIARKGIEFRRWLLLELRIMEHNWIFYTHYKWDYIKQNNVMDTANGDNLSRGWGHWLEKISRAAALYRFQSRCASSHESIGRKVETFDSCRFVAVFAGIQWSR